jgi:hypothetical protein
MPQVEFEPTIPLFERAKTVHILDRAANVIGSFPSISANLLLDLIFGSEVGATCFSETSDSLRTILIYKKTYMCSCAPLERDYTSIDRSVKCSNNHYREEGQKNLMHNTFFFKSCAFRHN